MAKEKDKSKPKVVKMTDAEEKKKALESVFSVIEKEYGTGSIMKLGDANSVDVEVIPTGSLTLDMALGVGGLPRGRVIEIYGPESSGKTTVDFTLWQRHRKWAARLHLLTRNTL